MSADDPQDLESEADPDPMRPETWRRTPDVCGSCIAWRPEVPREQDEVATGACRLRSELGRVPATLKKCDLYKPRGQFVYTPQDIPASKRRRSKVVRVMRRDAGGDLVDSSPPRRASPASSSRSPRTAATSEVPFVPNYERRPPPVRAPAPENINVGSDATLIAVKATIRDLLRREFGRQRRSMASKYRGGGVTSVRSDGASHKVSMDTLFNVVERFAASLDELDQAFSAHAELESETHYIKKIRGSFTTLNVIWADREDYFSGKG